MDHTKVGTSNLETDAKTGKGHKTSHNIQIQRTNCLHCTGNHRSHDCPTKHQHQAPPATNLAGSTGTYSHHSFSRFPNTSPQHHSQQSQSTIGSSTWTLMVDNNLWFQQGPQGQVTPPGQNQVNQQVRPPQLVNSQYNQLNIHQQSPVFPPQQFNAKYPHLIQDNGHCNCHLSTKMLLKQVKY